MSIVVNGSGTITGISTGGLPDNTVDAGTLATDSVTASKIAANSVDSAELIDGAVDDSHMASISGRKNIIINGSMRVAQRGTSFTDPASGAYTLDRWRAGVHTSTAAANYTQEADAPTAAQAGTNFVNCLKIDVTTADTSTADTVRYYTRYHVEGYDLARAGFGQAGVRYMTLSFWHKHTKTGINSFGFTPNDNGRHYVAEYTQTTSDTWEKATHTFPVDTSGNWLTNNGNGMTIYFVGHIGANYQKTPNAWGAGNGYGTANQVNNFDSTSNNMRFTGVQLEMGSTATDFEHRSYGEELALCQRYYLKDTDTGYHTAIGQNTDRALGIAWMLPVPFRASPTITVSGTSYALTHTTYNGTSSPSVHQSAYTVNESSIRVGFTGFSGITDNRLCAVELNTVTFDAEL